VGRDQAFLIFCFFFIKKKEKINIWGASPQPAKPNNSQIPENLDFINVLNKKAKNPDIVFDKWN